MTGTAGTRKATVRVGRNAVARLVAQVAARLLAFVLVALVSRYEGAAGLGRYVLITTVVGLVAAVTDLGLTVLLTREVAGERSTVRQQRLLGELLPLRVGLAVVGAGVIFGLSWVPFFAIDSRRLFFLAAVSLLPTTIIGMLGGFVNGRRRLDVTSSIEVAARLLTLAGAVPVLAAGLGVPGVIACTALGEGVGVLIYALVLRSWSLLPPVRLAPAKWRGALMEAYPFALTSIIAIAYRRLDIVLLGALQGDYAAGQYGAAYKLWEALGLIPASLLDALFPEMAHLMTEREGLQRLRRLYYRAVPTLLISGVLLSIGATALAGVLVPLVYGHAQTQKGATVAFRLLIWGVPAMFLYLLNGHVLYALGRQRSVTVAMGVVGVVNVALNLVVIPRWSVLGVSSVALFSALLLWGLLSALTRRALRTERNG